MREDYLTWLEKGLDEQLNNITLLGNTILIEMYSYDHKVKNDLIDLNNNLLSEKYGKEVFNLAKVLKTGVDYNGPVKRGDIVSLIDEMLEPIPDGSKGWAPDGEPKAGYMPLGKMIHYTYLYNKLIATKQPLMFIIPTSWITVINNKPEEQCTAIHPEVERT